MIPPKNKMSFVSILFLVGYFCFASSSMAEELSAQRRRG